MSKPVLFILSMIFAQTLRVFREGKPAAAPHQVRGRLFPGHALDFLQRIARLHVATGRARSRPI
jgi:hypothetical protein